VWGEKESSTRARSLTTPRRAGRSGAKGAGARHLREWSAEIRPLALRGRGFLLPFYFLVTWSLSQRDIWNPNRFRSRSRRDNRGLSYICDLPASTREISIRARVFCLLSLLRRHRSLLHPDYRRAPAIGRAGLRNRRLQRSCTGRGRIRFLGSALRDCSIASSASSSSSSTPSPRLVYLFVARASLVVANNVRLLIVVACCIR